MNYRAIIPGGVWRTSRRARWQIRPQQECYEALDEAGIRHRRIRARPTPVPSPIVLQGEIGGVRYRMHRRGEVVMISCELALRMQELSQVLRRHHVREVRVLSSYRVRPSQSYHTMGLALDVFSFLTDEGETLSVLEDFVETPAHTTCAAPRPAGRRRAHARTLLRIACDLWRSRRWSSVLTPNYNDGHRNHFHVDIRPNDSRAFVR